jgi:hypothetical protein
LRFAEVEILSRDAPPRVVLADGLPDAVLAPLVTPRAPIAGLPQDRRVISPRASITFALLIKGFFRKLSSDFGSIDLARDFP